MDSYGCKECAVKHFSAALVSSETGGKNLVEYVTILLNEMRNTEYCNMYHAARVCGALALLETDVPSQASILREIRLAVMQGYTSGLSEGVHSSFARLKSSLPEGSMSAAHERLAEGHLCEASQHDVLFAMMGDLEMEEMDGEKEDGA